MFKIMFGFIAGATYMAATLITVPDGKIAHIGMIFKILFSEVKNLF